MEGKDTLQPGVEKEQKNTLRKKMSKKLSR